MKRTTVLFLLSGLFALLPAQQSWYPHEGGLLKYRVNIRFGEEPDTRPAGWKFGRVSAVAEDKDGFVYVFHRGLKADPVVVFDAKGNYVRSFGRGMFGTPHGLRIDKKQNVYVGNSPVNIHRLGSFVLDQMHGETNAPVFIRCDENVTFGAFATVVDSLKQANVTNISIVTEPLSTKGSE